MRRAEGVMKWNIERAQNWIISYNENHFRFKLKSFFFSLQFQFVRILSFNRKFIEKLAKLQTICSCCLCSLIKQEKQNKMLIQFSSIKLWYNSVVYLDAFTFTSNRIGCDDMMAAVQVVKRLCCNYEICNALFLLRNIVHDTK